MIMHSAAYWISFAPSSNPCPKMPPSSAYEGIGSKPYPRCEYLNFH